MKADAAMTRQVVCIEDRDSLADAHDIMTEWEIRHLPVLAHGKLVGILSDRDVLVHAKRGERGLEIPDVPVVEGMTPHPIVCHAATSISAVGTAMTTHKIDCLPVVDEDGDLVGLVTSTDLIELLVTREQAAAQRPLPFNYQVYRSVRRGMADASAGYARA